VHFVGLFLSSLLKMHGPKNKKKKPSPIAACETQNLTLKIHEKKAEWWWWYLSMTCLKMDMCLRAIVINCFTFWISYPII